MSLITRITREAVERLGALILSVILFAISPSTLLHAQSNINRPYEPQVLQGTAFPNFSNDLAAINQLFLYKFNAIGNNWEQIPWQIDEVETNPNDQTKNTYFVAGDGLLDDKDELSFMAGDAGDQAPPSSWIDDAASRGFERYEIEVIDPMAQGNKRHVYLYRSPTLSVSPALQDYVNYVAAPLGNGEDIIQAQGYVEGHNAKGFNNSLAIPPSANGSGVNFVDQLKLRLKIKFLGINIPLSEDSFTFSGASAVDGRVRVVREIRLSLQSMNIPFLFKYYRHSVNFSAAINLTSDLGVSLLRQSFDFKSNVSGAKWYNQNSTRVITADGTDDALTADETAVVYSPALNWYMLSSSQGSFVGLFSLPGGLGTSQKFYYRDNRTGGTNDGTDDTGAESGSFGESGLWITGTNISGTFPLALTNYMLAKDLPAEVGKTLRDQALQPLQANVIAQSYVVPVELVTFTATAERNRAVLQWQTASETNNHGFAVERRFALEEWENIGFVAGHGTTTTPQSYRFTDRNVQPGEYFYRLRQIDTDGAFEITEARQVMIAAPERFVLSQNYPNPFSLSNSTVGTLIQYELSELAEVEVNLRIFNLLGQEVRRLSPGKQSAGYFKISWDGRNEKGELVPGGIYFYQLTAGAQRQAQKLVVVR
jgi:hypothetical protein